VISLLNIIIPNATFRNSRIGDFKRSSSKSWMMLKFGGLLECAEKATVRIVFLSLLEYLK